MKITKIEPFILHVPIAQKQIADATNSISHWGIVGAKISTNTGIVGYGYTSTHAHTTGDRAIANLISDALASQIMGENPIEVNKLWHKMYNQANLRWVGRAGIVHLAIGAIDTALWDIRAKFAEQPLWQHLGGSTCDELEAYNTDIGWLSNPIESLVKQAQAAVNQNGFRRIKLKVGQKNPSADVARIRAVRKAIGPGTSIAVDANGKWDLATAIRFCKQAEELDVFWLEEPLWYDDVESHTRLNQISSIPIALGEQLYSIDAFNLFFQNNAMSFAQPDVTRLAGVSEYLRVADVAYAKRMPVVAHVGDMGQVHVHLSFFHEMTTMLEYIPWIAHCFEEPIKVENGLYAKPQMPGASTTLTSTALERYGVSLR